MKGLPAVPVTRGAAPLRLHQFMSKRDTLKTAKICLSAIEMATDGYSEIPDRRKARRKERQKGKKIIKNDLAELLEFFGVKPQKKEE